MASNVPRDALAQALRTVSAEVGLDADPSWAPSVQGAVGHVVGLRSPHRRYVMKIYTADDREQHSRRERRALELVADYAGVPVPQLVAAGRTEGDRSAPYLVMTRLPGARLADRLTSLSTAQLSRLRRQIGRLLHRFHDQSPPAPDEHPFGGLLAEDPSWPTLKAAVEHRAVQLVRSYADSDTPLEVSRGVERWISRRLDVMNTCPVGVLCHNDFIDGNVLIGSEEPNPSVTGVTDFDRASFSDPMADLAQTIRNATSHRLGSDRDLLQGYGVTDSERNRLAVHHLLHTVAERLWISADRPAGWRTSLARLDAQLRDATGST